MCVWACAYTRVYAWACVWVCAWVHGGLSDSGTGAGSLCGSLAVYETGSGCRGVSGGLVWLSDSLGLSGRGLVVCLWSRSGCGQDFRTAGGLKDYSPLVKDLKSTIVIKSL